MGRMARGSRLTPVWMVAANFISPKRSVALLEETPSVPRAMFTPAFPMAGMGAIPEPSFRLDTGLWTQVIPFWAMMAQSSGVVQTQWAAMARVSHTPYWSRVWMGVLPLRSRLPWCSVWVSETCTCIPRPFFWA